MEDWFTVEPLAPDTWAISEYRHWEVWGRQCGG